MRGLYAGSDLHGNNNLVGIVDEQGKRIFKKRLPNEPELILEALKPYKEEMVGIAEGIGVRQRKLGIFSSAP